MLWAIDYDPVSVHMSVTRQYCIKNINLLLAQRPRLITDYVIRGFHILTIIKIAPSGTLSQTRYVEKFRNCTSTVATAVDLCGRSV